MLLLGFKLFCAGAKLGQIGQLKIILENFYIKIVTIILKSVESQDSPTFEKSPNNEQYQNLKLSSGYQV